MSVLKLLATDSFITVNRYIAKAVGLEAAVMLGELASEHQYHASRGQLEDGYFYSTLENIEEKTTLTRKKQDKAIKALTEKGIIDVNCRIEHREEILSLKYSPNEDTVWIHILAADMIHFSNALDGSEIIDAAEHVLGTIQDAKCIMKVEKGFNGSIAIRTPDGMICHLEVIP